MSLRASHKTKELPLSETRLKVYFHIEDEAPMRFELYYTRSHVGFVGFFLAVTFGLVDLLFGSFYDFRFNPNCVW